MSGRTVQLDEVSEPSEPRNETMEVVPAVIPMKEPEAPASDAGISEKLVTEPRRSGRTRLLPEWYANEVFILEDDEPVNYKEAMMSPNSTEWLKAMKSEMESMYENQVWDLVIPPEGVKQLNVNGFSKEIQTRMVMSLSIKLDLLQKGFDKCKELTTTRLSRQ